MKIWRMAQELDASTSLFDYCIKMGDIYPSSKVEWDKRAEQVANNEVTDYFFAVWLNRMTDHNQFGLLAKQLASKYFEDHK